MNEQVGNSIKSSREKTPLRMFFDKAIPYLKWIVYALLFTNLIYYGYEDWANAQHTLGENPTFMETLSAYATTLDDIAWIFLIALFEIETYWLGDDFDNKLVGGLIIAAKVFCYTLILQTTYAYLVTLGDMNSIPLGQNLSDLCAVAGQELSFVRNLSYADVNATTCASIPYSNELYLYPHETVITDASGLALEQRFAWIDVVENLSWLLIIILIEMSIQLQNRGHYDTLALKWSKRLEYAAYLAIILAAIHWFIHGHVLYAWDEFVWIAGFAMLDNNLAEWRHDLEDEAGKAAIETG